MVEILKPKIVVSKCLGFEACRYNGQIIKNDFVSSLKPYVDFITVCPEVEIGLGIPREPIRVLSDKDSVKLIQPASGINLTEKMNDFSASFLSNLPPIDGFILKGKSPSCGIRDCKIYVGKEKASRSEKGSGLFAGAILEKFPNAVIEDEGRLTNYRIREHFLIKLFTFFNFRKVKTSKELSKLVKFQSDNKYLLMSYHQREQKLLGKLVANHEKKSFERIVTEYEEHLTIAFSKPPRYTNNINMMNHIFGYFSEYLSPQEKNFLLNTFEKYRENKIPLSVPLYMLKAYALQYEMQYLLVQTIWCPYPEGLIDISNSGKEQ
jgi:uncharacterized protein YbgA (DUF1722 family)/uncharacterized protein YbbK (DUF523 family)